MHSPCRRQRLTECGGGGRGRVSILRLRRTRRRKRRRRRRQQWPPCRQKSRRLLLLQQQKTVRTMKACASPVYATLSPADQTNAQKGRATAMVHVRSARVARSDCAKSSFRLYCCTGDNHNDQGRLRQGVLQSEWSAGCVRDHRGGSSMRERRGDNSQAPSRQIPCRSNLPFAWLVCCKSKALMVRSRPSFCCPHKCRHGRLATTRRAASA
jgi:hypothetical protein